MNDEPKGGGSAGGIAAMVAMVVCCGGMLLVTTGVLSGIGAWLLGDGLAWLAVAAGAGAAGYFLWRRRQRTACSAPLEPAASETQSRRSKAA